MGHTPGSANEFGGAIEMDDGTSARTETPSPGPVGLDAPPGADTSTGIADRILGFARRQRGNRVGNGECFTFADRALSTAGARSAGDYGEVTPNTDYVWGSVVSLSDLQPLARGFRGKEENWAFGPVLLDALRFASGA
jgi:hypothetical protein